MNYFVRQKCRFEMSRKHSPTTKYVLELAIKRAVYGVLNKLETGLAIEMLMRFEIAV